MSKPVKNKSDTSPRKGGKSYSIPLLQPPTLGASVEQYNAYITNYETYRKKVKQYQDEFRAARAARKAEKAEKRQAPKRAEWNDFLLATADKLAAMGKLPLTVEQRSALIAPAFERPAGYAQLKRPVNEVTGTTGPPWHQDPSIREKARAWYYHDEMLATPFVEYAKKEWAKVKAEQQPKAPKSTKSGKSPSKPQASPPTEVGKKSPRDFIAERLMKKNIKSSKEARVAEAKAIKSERKAQLEALKKAPIEKLKQRIEKEISPARYMPGKRIDLGSEEFTKACVKFQAQWVEHISSTRPDLANREQRRQYWDLVRERMGVSLQAMGYDARDVLEWVKLMKARPKRPEGLDS